MRLIAGALAIVALLGVGFATYLWGGDGEEAETSGVPRIDFSKPPLRSYEPTEILRLDWGGGERDVWVDEGSFGSTLESFSIDEEGNVLIVDHPGWHVGARVRRFSQDGALLRTWLTPSGSTFFEPFGTGIMFVTARVGSGTEHVWLLSEDSSVEASFPVPANVNSTSLLRVGDLLMVTSEVPQLAENPDAMLIEPVMYPVVLLTTAGPVPSPVQRAEMGAGVDTLGQPYARVLESDSWFVHPGTTQTVSFADGRSLSLPGVATPVGIDRDVVWMTMPVAMAPDSYVDRAGWPWGFATEAEVLAGGFGGRLMARVVAPWSPLISEARRRAFVTSDSLWLLTADTEGAVIRRYEAAGADE